MYDHEVVQVGESLQHLARVATHDAFAEHAVRIELIAYRTARHVLHEDVELGGRLLRAVVAHDALVIQTLQQLDLALQRLHFLCTYRQ